ncbi:MAG: phage holin family protein [Chloroflexi bacterium]|nr:phage holin family protein [Chloroflexota bacterium]MCY3938231.1 phage holin family protein [Chloroflexota bacterium]
MLRRLLVQWASGFLGIVLVSAVLNPHVSLPPSDTPEYWSTAAGFAAVLAALNSLVRPALNTLLGPIKCLLTLATLGLTHFLIGALIFWLADTFIEAIEVESFTYLLLGALIMAIVGVIGSAVLGQKPDDKRS